MRVILAICLIALACGCICTGGGDNEPLTGYAASVAYLFEPTTTTLKKPTTAVKAANITKIPKITNIGEALFIWAPYRCTYANKINLGETIHSEIYMEGGRYHCTVTDTRRHKTHILSDRESIFVWEEDKPSAGQQYLVSQISGITGKIEAAEVANRRTVAIDTDLMDILSASEINCTAWNMTADTFTPPKKVIFRTAKGVYDTQYDSRLDKYAKETAGN